MPGMGKQFQPGESGNPAGRPVGQVTERRALRSQIELLNKKHKILENFALNRRDPSLPFLFGFRKTADDFRLIENVRPVAPLKQLIAPPTRSAIFLRQQLQVAPQVS